MSKKVLFQTIQFIISTQFKCQKQFYFKQLSIAKIRSLNVKTVLFHAIQLSISTQFSSIGPIDTTLSGTTTLRQIRPGSDGNKGVLRIPQSFSITGTSLLDGLVSLGRGSYPSAEK